MTMAFILLAILFQVPPQDPLEMATDAIFRVHSPGQGPSGTAFLVETPASPRKPSRTVLVTAAHVLDAITGTEARLVLRSRDNAGAVARLETPLALREGARPLYKKLKDVDVAAIAVSLPPNAHAKPFPLDRVLDSDGPSPRIVRLGREAWIPSYPAKAESNPAGQPVLRRGSIASQPYIPAPKSNTFLVDVTAFGGDSGAPVVVLDESKPHVAGLVMGMLRETDRSVTPFEEKVTHMPLGISIVIKSQFVRQAVALID